jgi:hypothetical protein
MIRALLAGTKAQTRRVVKPTPVGLWGGTNLHKHTFVGIANGKNGASEAPVDHCWRCPYGQPGDRLWVRESFRKIIGDAHGWIETDYRATYEPGARMGDHLGVKPKWSPSIHMPRAASRITLEITDVRAERLNDITTGDAEAEGWPGPDEDNTIASAYPIAWYARLWNQINGKRHPWDSNPWVWVVSFVRDPGGK